MSSTTELGTFLRSRRERLTPADVGLPDRGRLRRTPGLRREEVAALADVSTDYVVRLEQGRGLRPSPEVLEALARALRLTGDERSYLFDLARQRQDHRSTAAGRPAESVTRLIDDLSPLPAMLVDHRFDILAWNPEMAGLMCDFGALPDQQRNVMWLCLLHADFSTFYRDRERVVREGIADLRAAWAAHPHDESLARLVDELRSHSEEFADLWARQDVRVNGRGRKRLQHPRVGPLTVDFETLQPLQDPDQRLVVYRPADEPSRVALDAIADAVAAPRRARAGVAP